MCGQQSIQPNSCTTSEFCRRCVDSKAYSLTLALPAKFAGGVWIAKHTAQFAHYQRNLQGILFAEKFSQIWRKCVGIEPTRDSSNYLSSGLKPEPITRQISLPHEWMLCIICECWGKIYCKHPQAHRQGLSAKFGIWPNVWTWGLPLQNTLVRSINYRWGWLAVGTKYFSLYTVPCGLAVVIKTPVYIVKHSVCNRFWTERLTVCLKSLKIFRTERLVRPTSKP